jgi:hypothetical protein
VFRDQGMGLCLLVNEPREGGVGELWRQVLSIEAQVLRPKCFPLAPVGAPQSSDGRR